MTIRMRVESPAQPHGELLTIRGDVVLHRDGDWLMVDTGVQVHRIHFRSISEGVDYRDAAATLRANRPDRPAVNLAQASATLGQVVGRIVGQPPATPPVADITWSGPTGTEPVVVTDLADDQHRQT